MKELSIEQKAQRYDEALEIAKEINNECKAHPFNVMTKVFPELKESEDERIKKALIDYFDDANKADENPLQSYGIYTDKAIAWLKKQGTSYTKKEVDDAYLKGITDTKNEIEKQYEANYQIRKDIATFIFNYRGDIKDRAKWIDYLGIKVSFVEKQGEQETLCDKCRKEHPSHSCQDITELGRCALEKQGEQTHADKVKPKFNEGDWAVSNLDGKTRQILEVRYDEYNNYYVVENDAHNIEEYDRLHHLWTIRDAKDGDVLIDKNYMGEHPFIFKEIKPSNIKTNIPNPLTVLGYCGIGGAGFTKGDWWGDTANCIYYPATKEQRDLLFQKMKEAGYEWDAKKKELKKIEQKTDWSERDENVTDIILSQLRSDNFSGVLGKSLLKAAESWLNSLKGRMQPKQEWSKEDESYLNTTIAYLKDAKEFKKTAENCINWLKSLRPQKQWKPSEEQIATIEYIIRGYESTAIHLYAGAAKQLYSLLEQFKQL